MEGVCSLEKFRLGGTLVFVLEALFEREVPAHRPERGVCERLL